MNLQPADYKSAALPIEPCQHYGGHNRARTYDPLLVRQMLSQLSYATIFFLMVEENGFEPLKQLATDLQSAPFGHSGTPPYLIGAGNRT